MSKYDPQYVPVEDQATQRALDELRRASKDMARDPVIDRTVVRVDLVDSVVRKVKHGLGRKPVFYTTGIITGATSTGRIVETRPSADGSGPDPTKEIWLTATGHGATITVDILVF